MASEASGALQNLNGSNTVASLITLASPTSLGGQVGQLTLSGQVAGGGDLSDIGAATLVLQNSNSYTGETIINGIVLVQYQANALGASVSGTVVNNGGTLELGNGYAAFGEALTLNGNGLGYFSSGGLATPLGALVCVYAASSSNTGTGWFGDITLGSNVTIDSQPTTYTSNSFVNVVNLPGSANGLTLYGNISDNGNHFGVTKVGAGIATYWSPVTYSGPTIVTSGVLSVAGQGTLEQSTVTVGVNANFALDDTASDVSNRYTGNLNLDGGTFTYLSNNNPGVISTESLGVINLLGGNNTISSLGGTGLGDATIITSAGLTRRGSRRQLRVGRAKHRVLLPSVWYGPEPDAIHEQPVHTHEQWNLPRPYQRHFALRHRFDTGPKRSELCHLHFSGDCSAHERLAPQHLCRCNVCLQRGNYRDYRGARH